MKKLATLCLAACLAAALATPAGALDYAIDAPEGPDYGKPTSVEVVHTADGGALKNEDISKNAALIPPGFGSASADTLNTGTWLTPNLAPEGMAVGTVNGSGTPHRVPALCRYQQLHSGYRGGADHLPRLYPGDLGSLLFQRIPGDIENPRHRPERAGL